MQWWLSSECTDHWSGELQCGVKCSRCVVEMCCVRAFRGLGVVSVMGRGEEGERGNERNEMEDFGLNLDRWNGWMRCWGGEGIGVDFAEFVLS